MPRSKRLIPVGLPIHVMSRSNNRLTIFGNDRDKLRYYILLLKFKRENNVDILHYCIMHNHVHLLIIPGMQTKLSKFMQQVNLSYFCYYESKNKYTGHLWQGRFKSKIIDSDAYLLQCGKYIELNPVRAGIVQLPEDYRFSSYNFYAAGVKDRLVTANPFYAASSALSSDRQDKYIELPV